MTAPVHVLPLIITSTPGGDATFYCFSTMGTIVSIQWLVNGLSIDYFRNIQTELESNTWALTFHNLPPEYNDTRIRCAAELSSGRSSYNMEPALLIVQG